MEQTFEDVKFIGKNSLLYVLPDYEKRTISKNKSDKTFVSLERKNCFAALPMIAYKVIMPMPEQHELNLFQLAVLRLMKIRNYSNSELSDKLCIKEELVDLVIAQLMRHEYLDTLRGVTSIGEDSLMGIHHIKTNLLGYVFYNVLTKDFEDFFLEEKNYRVFGYTTKGNSFSFNAQKDISGEDIWITAYDLTTEDVRSVTPPPLLRERALSICRSAIGRFYAQNDPDALIGEKSDTGFDISKFSVNVVSKPKACYVVSVAYMTKGPVWVASDPFFLKPSETIRRCFSECKIPQIEERLASLSRTMGTAGNFDHKEYNREQREHLEKLKAKIRSAFGSVNVDEYFFVFAAKAVGAYQQLNSGEIRENIQYEREIERYVDNCYRMLEHALSACWDRFWKYITEKTPDFKLTDYFTEDILSNAQLLSSLAFGLMGFAKAPEMNENAFLRVTRTSIREYKDEHNMQELVAANLILAKNHAEHPFRSLNGYKGFISDAAALKTYRDPIRHEFRLDFVFDDVKEYLQKVFDYSAWLLSAEKYNKMTLEELLRTYSGSIDLENDSRLLNDCLNEIAASGIDVSQYNDSAVVKLLQKVLFYCKMEDDDGFIMNSAILFEEILRRFRSELRENEVINYIEDKATMSDQLTVMKKLCGCEQLQCLPDSLENFDAFFEHAGIFHYKRNPPCSSALFHALICAQIAPQSRFAVFICGNKQFVEDLCLVHIMRGHGSVGAEKKHLHKNEIATRMIGYVKQILE